MLRDVYDKILQELGNDAQHYEPYESVALVEKYRQYWKPTCVKIILLAESHVFTSDNDRAIALRGINDLPDYPAEYAKFVYCLAYGERHLTNNPAMLLGDRTPQFWKIFASCNTPFNNERPIIFDHVLCTHTRDPEERVHNKIELLKDLKKKGIWLVDTSILAVYRKSTELRRSIKLPKMNIAIRKSWELYTRNIVVSGNPAHVICIGKGVANIVGKDLKAIFPKDRVTVIPQPNAHLSAVKHEANFKKYSETCCGNTGSH